MQRLALLILLGITSFSASPGCRCAQIERRCHRQELRSYVDCRCERTPREKIMNALRRVANSDAVKCAYTSAGIYARLSPH